MVKLFCNRKRKCFIGHSSADADIANLLVELLMDVGGFSESQIFCSSFPRSLEVGVEFMKEIRHQVNSCDAYIPLVSDSFNWKSFCQWELGAAWALNKKIFPLMYPMIQPTHLGDIISKIQAANISDEKDLISLISGVTFGTSGSINSRKRIQIQTFIEKVEKWINHRGNWIYALVSKKNTEQDHKVIGHFRVVRNPRDTNSMEVRGKAYYLEVDGKTKAPQSFNVEYRGDWKSVDMSYYSVDHLVFKYYMDARGRKPNISTHLEPSHFGFIDIHGVDDKPIIGIRTMKGEVHDIGDWVGNTPVIFAEEIQMTTDDLDLKIREEGADIFKKLIKHYYPSFMPHTTPPENQ